MIGPGQGLLGDIADCLRVSVAVHGYIDEGRLAQRVTVPVFPRDWSDRLGGFFSQVRLRYVDGVGHFAPLEYPDVLAEEIRAVAGS